MLTMATVLKYQSPQQNGVKYHAIASLQPSSRKQLEGKEIRAIYILLM
jgi:hypothetical protein